MDLIRTIAADRGADVAWVENKEDHTWRAALWASDKTRQLLDSLVEMLLSEEAVAIDYIDIKQLLIAAYKAYDQYFSVNYDPAVHFRTVGQRDTYAICVLGLITSLLVPEDGKKWCKGIYFVVNNIQPSRPNPNAEACQLDDGRSLYRPTRDSRSGSGFQFLVNIYGAAPGGPSWSDWREALCWNHGGEFLEDFVQQTRQRLANLRGECITEQIKLPHLGRT